MDDDRYRCDRCYDPFPARQLTYHGTRIGLLCPRCHQADLDHRGKTCPACGKRTYRLHRPRLAPKTATRICRRCAEAKDNTEAAKIAQAVRRALETTRPCVD